MILSLIAVGESYQNKIDDALTKFNSYNICLLSDIQRSDVFYFEKYKNETFSYFDKLYFSLEMVSKFNEDVFYIDINKIDEVYLDFPKNDLFYYKSNWPYGDTFGDYVQYEYFKPIIDYWSKNNINYLDLPVIRETELFFNKEINVSEIVKKLKQIQPIFREMSELKQTYSGYDNAEGLALSYVLKSMKII
jgi:hypothetical protein